MYLDHRIMVKIERILHMIDMSALLFDASGNVLFPEGDSRVFTLPEALLNNPTIPLVYGSFTMIGTDEERGLFVCLKGESDETKKCAILCAELINTLMRADMAQTTDDQALRMLLRGEVEEGEEESLAADHGIFLNGTYCVLYIHLSGIESEAAVQMFETGFEEDVGRIAEVGRHDVAIIKTIESDEDVTEALEYARALCDTFLTEAGGAATVGISEPRTGVAGLRDSYEEARRIISIGKTYHPEQNIFVYRSLLLERFLDRVSPELASKYNAKIFNKRTVRLFNDEMLTTIETFFDNSLNLSETARKLYIHRNTLVYRLEKVQKEIGLDLRNFDDAVTFKMMLLLGKSAQNKKSKP